MQTEKCFCHFNGYEVKDAKARKNITKLESDIIEVNENANILDTKIEQNKGSINLANEEIANIKNSVASNAYDIGVIATNTANANANIIKLESDITSLNNNLNQANENITGLQTRVDNDETTIQSLDDRIKNIEENPAQINVIDNLESESATDPLSANQGRIINQKIIGTVLYEATENETEISLSDDIANYDVIEIYGSNFGNGAMNSTKIIPSKSNSFILSMGFYGNNAFTWKTTDGTFNGTRLSLSGGSLALWTTGGVAGSASSVEIFVKKVVGYKYE